MNHTERSTRILMLIIAIVAAYAAAVGIFSVGGPGNFYHESVRGEQILIYGTGLYRHMSADVAIQGIAQDYITLFLAVPALIIAALRLSNITLRRRLFAGGTLGYFFVSYTMYLCMGTYNALFLVYAFLAGASLVLLMRQIIASQILMTGLEPGADLGFRFPGIFLIINGAIIASLWLMEVVPPLIDGSLYPSGLDHYTTLIVQGLDLAFFLPLSIICGCMLLKGRVLGVLGSAIYLVFLVYLMTALTAKLIAMGINAVEIMPAIIIIPSILVIDIFAALIIFHRIGAYGIK